MCYTEIAKRIKIFIRKRYKFVLGIWYLIIKAGNLTLKLSLCNIKVKEIMGKKS